MKKFTLKLFKSLEDKVQNELAKKIIERLGKQRRFIAGITSRKDSP